MEILIAQILGVIDIVYILVCNAASYASITSFESINGKKALKTWHKRLISTIMAVLLGVLFVITFDHNLENVVVGFFLQFLCYDYLLKPIIKKMQGLLGFNSDDTKLT